ncbi:MAG: hypothetical protein SGI88_04135 [Candidatus Hydrogenedentes bacterium]|nr:hypothetical protein [Candidatus Hydrogenedentota bacterium]
MNTLLLILALVMAAAFVVTFSLVPWRARISGWRRWVTAIGCVFVIVGALCFFAPLISCLGGLDWLPSTFEWPIGLAKGVIATESGLRVVPHAPSNRVQVYEADWRYLRGWRVDAAGGAIALRPAEDGNFDVFTARGSRHYVYTVDGALLSTGESAKYPGDLGLSVFVPTPWWAVPLTHPFGGWAIAAAGLIAVVIADRGGKKDAADARNESKLLNRLLAYVQRETGKGSHS